MWGHQSWLWLCSRVPVITGKTHYYSSMHTVQTNILVLLDCNILYCQIYARHSFIYLHISINSTSKIEQYSWNYIFFLLKVWDIPHWAECDLPRIEHSFTLVSLMRSGDCCYSYYGSARRGAGGRVCRSIQLPKTVLADAASLINVLISRAVHSYLGVAL